MKAFFWLRKIREINKSVAVIMITAYGDIDLAVRSVKEGATDFVLKPWRNEKLLVTIEEALEKSALENPISNKNKKSAAPTIINSLLGKSEAMQDIFYKIEKIAPTDANILILGE
eukprot:Opistho-2@41939